MDFIRRRKSVSPNKAINNNKITDSDNNNGYEAKTYFGSETMRRVFESNYERSTRSPPTPRTKSFVKKLVASLENKMRSGGDCQANNEFIRKTYIRPRSMEIPLPDAPQFHNFER